MTALALLGWSLVLPSVGTGLMAAAVRLALSGTEAPARRAGLAMGALLFSAGGIVLSAGWLGARLAAVEAPAGAGAAATAAGRDGGGGLVVLLESVTPVAALLGGLWLGVVLLLAARHGARELRLRRRLARRARPARLRWRREVEAVARRLGVRHKVRVLETELVDSPALIAGRRPTLLLPPVLLASLGDAERRAILRHEMAHLRNGHLRGAALLLVAETLLFFHPSAHWLGGVVRAERERQCDVDAAEACGNARLYARALARLECVRSGPRVLALAAHGTDVLSRIRWLMDRESSAPATQNPHSRTAMFLPIAFAAALSLAGAVLAAPSTARALAAAGAPDTYTVEATDGAGRFTMSITQGRATAVSLDGVAVPSHALVQLGDSVHVRASGRATFSVRIKPQGGIEWTSR